MSTIGVVVLSVQGMQHLRECLESVRWADRVAVWHVGEAAPGDGSALFPGVLWHRVAATTDLADLARPVDTDWVLHLWGEERVEAELPEALRAVCGESLSNAPPGYRISIRSRLLGRWVEGSLLGPSPAPRLSRKSEDIASGWWSRGADGSERYPDLRRGWIGDYSARELSAGVEQIRRISDIWAERMRGRGRLPAPTDPFVTPLRTFVKILALNSLFSGGFAALTLSILAAYGTILADAKVWEASNTRERKRDRE